MELTSLMSRPYTLTHQQQQQQGGVRSGGMLSRPLDMNSNSSNCSTIGHKRDFSGNPVNANSQDSQDGGNFVKLFVGSVPRTITEEEVQPMFTEHGNVLEVALIKDKRTGQQQGCCFVKYGTIEEAERAIRALNNQRTLTGGTAPVQVRYADGERERLGAVEHKLFVGSLNKAASEKEIQELFAPYGRVDDVYIMRDEQKQSRGCAFIKFPTREMATAAISALNGIYIMPGCDQALAVRFADPKRPKGGDARVGGPGFGGPGFYARATVANRIAPAAVSQIGVRGPPVGGWRSMGGPGMGPQSQVGLCGYGASLGPRGGLGSVALGYYQQNAQRHQQASTQPYGQVPAAQQQLPQQSAQQILLAQSPQLSQGPGPPQLQHQMQQPRQLQPPQQQLQSQHLQPQQHCQNLMHSHAHLQQQSPQQAYYQMPSIQQAQHQPSWVLPVQQHAVSTLPPLPTLPTTCEWTEHTSPEGHKYYYNSSTAESKWEKPEEFVAFEQQPAAQTQSLALTTPGITYVQPQAANGSIDQPQQQGPPGANLFVFRIPDDFTEETLKETFTPFGNVIIARVGMERESGRSQGFGLRGSVAKKMVPKLTSFYVVTSRALVKLHGSNTMICFCPW